MSKQSKILLGITAIIGISAGSPAFADTIHGALESNRQNEPEVSRIFSVRPSSTPWTINEYVKVYRQAVETSDALKSQTIAEMVKPAVGTWQEALGNPAKL